MPGVNLPCGESLVRQIQPGQKFFRLVLKFPGGPQNHTESY